MKNLVTILCVSATFVCSIALAQSTPTKEIKMENYTVVQKPSITIVGIDCRTSNSTEAAPVDIPKLWGRFMGEDIFNKIPNKSSHDVIALYCDYEGDYTQPYTMVIGCAVSSTDDIPDGMVTKIVPAGSYAIFRAVGEHPQSVIKMWEHIWGNTDLKRTYTGDYEVYGEKFIMGSPKEVEVVIAIES